MLQHKQQTYQRVRTVLVTININTVDQFIFHLYFPYFYCSQCQQNKGGSNTNTHAHCKHNLPVKNIGTFFWAVMQHTLVISYGRFGTTYWSHLQGSNKTMLNNIPEARRPHLHRGEITRHHIKQTDVPFITDKHVTSIPRPLFKYQLSNVRDKWTPRMRCTDGFRTLS